MFTEYVTMEYSVVQPYIGLDSIAQYSIIWFHVA